ncbi:uncharacterized protein LOC142972764 isoform X2 [Anticarsia gemmatalis]|uniref:uncharacterized protein LOC142972764 isoform X2 n=1 Tax=Anticarsia gemmatalis TaxID=129554 RepID=UPI003F76577C
MAGHFLISLAALCAAASAAPADQQRLFPQHAPEQLQQVSPLDYYLQHPGVDSYYRPAEQKEAVQRPNGQSSRLESLEPDSEVELVPGVQQPQQPPQQNPVAPNIPGIAPGQRVFIVHMPVPGYRPGTIGGYQPVYIVAAAPQGNAAYPGNGYQNAVLLDPSGQAVVSPLVGYGTRGVVPPQLLGAPLTVQRPYDLVFQDPGLAQVAGQPIQGDVRGEPIRFSNSIGFQGPVNPLAYQPVVAVQSPTPVNKGASGPSGQLKQPSEEPKEQVEQNKKLRGSPGLLRNKA